MSENTETVYKTDQEVQEAIRSGQIEEERGHSHDEEQVDDSPTEDDGTSGLEDERHTLSVESAFVVFFQDGEAFGVGSLGDVAVKLEGQEIYLEPEKVADTATMWRGCTEVAKDIVVHEQAVKTVEAMQAHTLQMQRALQQQKQDSKPGGGRLHVPGQ